MGTQSLLRHNPHTLQSQHLHMCQTEYKPEKCVGFEASHVRAYFFYPRAQKVGEEVAVKVTRPYMLIVLAKLETLVWRIHAILCQGNRVSTLSGQKAANIILWKLTKTSFAISHVHVVLNTDSSHLPLGQNRQQRQQN